MEEPEAEEGPPSSSSGSLARAAQRRVTFMPSPPCEQQHQQQQAPQRPRARGVSDSGLLSLRHLEVPDDEDMPAWGKAGSRNALTPGSTRPAALVGCFLEPSERHGQASLHGQPLPLPSGPGLHGRQEAQAHEGVSSQEGGSATTHASLQVPPHAPPTSHNARRPHRHLPPATSQRPDPAAPAITKRPPSRASALTRRKSLRESSRRRRRSSTSLVIVKRRWLQEVMSLLASEHGSALEAAGLSSALAFDRADRGFGAGVEVDQGDVLIQQRELDLMLSLLPGRVSERYRLMREVLDTTAGFTANIASAVDAQGDLTAQQVVSMLNRFHEQQEGHCRLRTPRDPQREAAARRHLINNVIGGAQLHAAATVIQRAYRAFKERRSLWKIASIKRSMIVDRDWKTAKNRLRTLRVRHGSEGPDYSISPLLSRSIRNLHIDIEPLTTANEQEGDPVVSPGLVRQMPRPWPRFRSLTGFGSISDPSLPTPSLPTPPSGAGGRDSYPALGAQSSAPTLSYASIQGPPALQVAALHFPAPHPSLQHLPSTRPPHHGRVAPQGAQTPSPGSVNSQHFAFPGLPSIPDSSALTAVGYRSGTAAPTAAAGAASPFAAASLRPPLDSKPEAVPVAGPAVGLGAVGAPMVRAGSHGAALPALHTSVAQPGLGVTALSALQQGGLGGGAGGLSDAVPLLAMDRCSGRGAALQYMWRQGGTNQALAPLLSAGGAHLTSGPVSGGGAGGGGNQGSGLGHGKRLSSLPLPLPPKDQRRASNQDADLPAVSVPGNAVSRRISDCGGVGSGAAKALAANVASLAVGRGMAAAVHGTGSGAGVGGQRLRERRSTYNTMSPLPAATPSNRGSTSNNDGNNDDLAGLNPSGDLPPHTLSAEPSQTQPGSSTAAPAGAPLPPPGPSSRACAVAGPGVPAAGRPVMGVRGRGQQGTGQPSGRKSGRQVLGERGGGEGGAKEGQRGQQRVRVVMPALRV